MGKGEILNERGEKADRGKGKKSYLLNEHLERRVVEIKTNESKYMLKRRYENIKRMACIDLCCFTHKLFKVLR